MFFTFNKLLIYYIRLCAIQAYSRGRDSHTNKSRKKYLR